MFLLLELLLKESVQSSPELAVLSFQGILGSDTLPQIDWPCDIASTTYYQPCYFHNFP